MSGLSVSLFENPSAVTGEELNRDLLLLPAWRREKVLSYRFLIDRVLCAKAYLLLTEALRSSYGIDCSPAFDYGRNGKPLLRDYPEIHFNLSHCRRGVLCVVADEPVGCDIEEIGDSIDPDLCKACHSESEIAAILSSEDPCAAFTALWTRKEAFLKLTGEGVSNRMPSLFPGDALSGIRFETVVRRDRGFVYSISKHSVPPLTRSL